MQVPGNIVQARASPAQKFGKIEVLPAPTATRTEEPWPALHIPRYRHAIPVHQNIGCLSGELVGFLAPSKLGDRPLGECADSIQPEHVEAGPVLDQAIGREAGVVTIVEQSKSADHRCEILPLYLSCPISLMLPAC